MRLGTILEGIHDYEKIKGDNTFETSDPAKDKKPAAEQVYQMIDKKAERQWDEKRETFLCARPQGTGVNFNKNITDELEKLERIYEIQQDKGRMY